jgi:hypothetical protein
MFQTLATVAFLLTDRYASRAFVQLPYDFWLNLCTVSFAKALLLAESIEIHAFTKGTQTAQTKQ